MTPARQDSVLQVEVGGGEDWPDGSTTAAVRAAQAAFLAAGRDRGRTTVELSLVLSDDVAVRALNRDWRGQDKPTNVLAFPAGADEAPGASGAPLLLGDVVLARETVIREAGEQEKPVEAHLMHLVVHGVLHLLGFDHRTEAEAEVMEAAETAILGGLGVADPYGTAAGAPAPAAE